MFELLLKRIVVLALFLAPSVAGASDWEDLYWDIYDKDGVKRGELSYEEHAGNYAIFRSAPRGSRFFILGLDDIYSVPAGSSGYYMMYNQPAGTLRCSTPPPFDQHGASTDTWGMLEIVWDPRAC